MRPSLSEWRVKKSKQKRPETTFDRSALALKWFERKKHGNKELLAYYDAVYAAYSKAFQIDLDVFPPRGHYPDEDGLEGLFRGVVQAYENARSPFAGYMCGTGEITDLYQRYGSSLDASITRLQHLHLMMLVELVERIWGGGDKPHHVTQADLDACGYPQSPAPDPFYFW
jgi:hypothetical protein